MTSKTISTTCSGCGKEIKGRICQGLRPDEHWHQICAAKHVWESDPQNALLTPDEEAWIKARTIDEDVRSVPQ